MLCKINPNLFMFNITCFLVSETSQDDKLIHRFPIIFEKNKNIILKLCDIDNDFVKVFYNNKVFNINKDYLTPL